MKEMKGIIESYVLNHDRNKRLLALFLALAILVSFVVPASLIQPANSLTVDNGNVATPLSNATEIVTSTDVSKPATGTYMDNAFFEEACTYIPKGADNLNEFINSVSVTYGGQTYTADSNNNITIEAGSNDPAEFKLSFSYTLTSDFIRDNLSTDEPCVYYVLPEGFEANADMYGTQMFIVDANYSSDKPAAYFSIDKETGLIVIQFTNDYIKYIKDKTGATGTLSLNGKMNRADTADGDSTINVGDFTIKAEFDDKPNTVSKSQGVVTANESGGADITWTVTVYNAGYGFKGWSVTDDCFNGNAVTVSPSGNFGTFNGNTFTFTNEPDGNVDKVTFTYTKHLTVDEVEAMYDANNTAVKNHVDIKNEDGLTNSAENTAWIEKPFVEKTGTPDYAEDGGSYGNAINWEIKVVHPYGGSLNGYVVSDTYMAGSSVTVTDVDGNVLKNGTDYIHNGDTNLTLKTNKSQVVISYATEASVQSYTNNAILKKNDITFDSDTETVNYENATNLSKKGVYDPENNRIVWIITATSHIGFLNDYKVHDYSAFGSSLYINSLDDIDIISVSGKEKDGTSSVELTLSNGNYVDSDGNIYGTVTYVSEDSNGYVYIDSGENNYGITNVEFSFSQYLGDTIAPSYSNNAQDDNSNNSTAQVETSCQYQIDKSGTYNAQGGTIDWKISVKNNTDLDTASLNGVVLTDNALVGMSAADLSLDSALSTDGSYNYTLTSSGNIATVKDSSGNAVATLTIDSANGTVTFSDVAPGFNYCRLKYTKAVDEATIKQAQNQATKIANTLQADVPGEDPDPKSSEVTITNPYEIKKSGSYVASTGNIVWTVEVANTSGTLGGVKISDDAFANLASGTSIEIESVNGYNDWSTITSTSNGDSFNFAKSDGTSFGSMTLNGSEITFADSESGKGVRYVKFTYQTKASAANGESETNTISSNKVDDVTSSVTVSNPYTMSKEGTGYDPETGLLTWQVTVSNGTNSKDTLDGVVLYDEAFKKLVGDITFVSAKYDYLGTNLYGKSESGVLHIYCSDWYDGAQNNEFGTLTVNADEGTLTFKDYSGSRGLHEVTFTYKTKATAAEIAEGTATNTIGTHGTGVGPAEDVTAEQGVTNRDVQFTKVSKTANETVYGDSESNYTPKWEINIRKDDGYSTQTPILVDVLSADNGGKHYITDAQITQIEILAKEYDSGEYVKLDSQYYQAIGENAVTDDSGNMLGYSQFSITFTNDVDAKHYRYLQIVYNTTADVSGVVGESSGTTAHFKNSATFNGDKNGDDSFEYTEIPKDYVEHISLTVKKTWADSSNAADKRQDITFVLEQKIGDNGEWTAYDSNSDGNPDTFTISQVDNSDSWSLVIENLPKTTTEELGLESIYYRVREISSIDGYVTSYNNNSGTNQNGAAIEIINTLVSVEVEKAWVGNDPKKDLSPVDVKLQYKAKDADDSAWADYENGSATLESENSWKYKWTALDPDYVYRVVEESAISGFTTTYSADYIDGVNNQYFKITNTSNNVKIDKHWVDNNYADRPSDVTVTLYKVETDGTKTEVSPQTLSGTDYQELTWYELDPDATYYVEESTPDGYAVSYSKADQTVKVGESFSITNTLVSVEVEKAWLGYQNGTVLPDITVKLQYSSDGGETWADYTADGETPYTATLSSGNLKHKWTALNPNYVYRVVEESAISGFTTTYSANYIDGVNNQYFKITNTSNNIKINKHWDDNNDTANRPKDVTVTLYKVDDSGTKTEVSPQTLSGSDWQELTWYRLESGYRYYVEESTVDGYVTIYKNSNVETQYAEFGDTISITNTKNNIKIEKQWKNVSGNDMTASVESIKLDVYQRVNGKVDISETVADEDRQQHYDDDNKPSHCEYKLCDLKAGDTLTLTIKSKHGSISYFNGCLGGANSAGEWIQEGWSGTVNNYTIVLTFDITQDLNNVILQTWYNSTDNNNSSDHVESVEYSIERWTYLKTITVTPNESGSWSYNLSNLETGIAPGEYIYKVVEQSVDGFYVVYDNNNGVTPTSNQTIKVTNKQAETVDKKAFDGDGNVIANSSLIKPSDLEQAEIGGVQCYLIKYKLTPNGTSSTNELTDTLPQGWTLCETEPYKVSATWSNGWTGTLNNGSGNEYYTYNDGTLYIKYGSAEYVTYYISIPKETLNANIESANSVLVENTAVLKSDNAQPTTNKIVITNQTSSGTDDSLIEKTVSYLSGSDFTYRVVFNPEGKDLANGDFVDIYDDFDIVDYIKNNSSISADELAKMEATLTSIKFEKLLSYEYKDDGIGGTYLDYTADETVKLNTSYHVDYKPYEIATTDLEFVKTTDGEYTVWTATSGYKVGDVVTFVIDASAKSSNNKNSTNGPYLCKDGDFWNKRSSIYDLATYDEETKQWTYTFTVDQEYSSLAIYSRDVDYNWGDYYHDYVTDVSATATTTTQLSTASLSMTVPDETPIIITYVYNVSGMSKGDKDDIFKLKLNNDISFDTGNYNASDSADKTEFTIIEAVGTITANTAPSIKKVSISDYSVEVDAEFKIAYYDAKNGWVFAVDEKQEKNNVSPVWVKTSDSGDVTAITQGETIPSGAHTFKIGSININLENGKLYKLIETSMPFNYQGGDLAKDFNENYLGKTGTAYDAYITAVTDSMTAAGRTAAIFEDLLQGYLAGADSPYSAFFSEFNPIYYFAYGESAYAKPENFAESVTNVSTNGELLLNNSEMIEITIEKSWDQNALDMLKDSGQTESVEVSSIVELYWSTVKKSTGFPENLNRVTKDSFSSLANTGFENPKTVSSGGNAEWGLLPSGYKGQPIYYYVKEIGYKVGDNAYYYYEDADDYVLGTRNDQTGVVTPTLDESGNYQTVGIKPIYTGNGTNNNPNWTDKDNNKKVEIKIVNTAGIKIEKLWKKSDGTALENLPLDSVPITLYGTKDGIETIIGNFTVSAENNWNCIVDRDQYKLDEYSSFRVVENVPAEQRHLIYGYTISYGYNLNGASGTITVTNKDNTPTKIDVTANKTWSDSADHSEHSIQLSLYQTTTAQPTEGVDETGGTAYGEPVTLNAENSWSYTWNDLPYKSDTGLRYYYYVIETQVSAGNVEYKPSYSRSDSASKQTLEITNYVPGSINIEKTWQDTNNVTIPNSSALLPESIEVEIYRRPDVEMVGTGGETLPSGIKVFADGDSITNGFWNPQTPYPAALQNLLTENGSTGSTVLNKGESGNYINQLPHGYTAGYDLFTLIIGTNDVNAGYSVDTIISDYTALLDKIKQVDSETVLFVGGIPHEDFLKDGAKTTCYSYVGGDDYYSTCKFYDLKTQAGYAGGITNEAIQEFENLFNAHIDEVNAAIKSLVESYEGLTIVYVDIPSALDTLGDNAWHDGCHPSQEGYNTIAETFYNAINTYYGVGTSETPKNIENVPENITDENYYEKVGEYTLEKSKDWKLSVELPTMNEKNENYVYYVVEKATGYTAKYSANGQIIGDNDGDIIGIKNTVDTAKTSITVQKTWLDGENTAKRPSTITLKLNQKLESATDWEKIDEITLKADDDWQAVISDLEVSDLNGEKYCYQVVEEVPSGYIVTYGETNGAVASVSPSTIEITNTESFDLTVKKLWADENHVLNEGVTIQIWRDITEDNAGKNLTLMPLQLALVSPENGEITVTKGKTAQVAVNKDAASVAFSDNLATATIDGKTITVTAGDSPGDTVMTVTDNDGQTVTVNITISDKPTLSITLSQDTIEAGQSATISAQLSDGTSTAGVAYEIIDGTAATLSGNTLTGKGNGNVKVKATLTIDGDTYEAEATLTVTLPSEFTLSASASEVSIGSTVNVTPSPNYGTFTYTSSDDSIATVDENGTVTGVSAGDVTITATRNDGKTAEVTITVLSGPLATVSSGNYFISLDSAKTIDSVSMKLGDISETTFGFNFYLNNNNQWNDSVLYLGYVTCSNGTLSSQHWNNPSDVPTATVNGETIVYTNLNNSGPYLLWIPQSGTFDIQNVVVTYTDGTMVTYSAASPSGAVSTSAPASYSLNRTYSLPITAYALQARANIYPEKVYEIKLTSSDDWQKIVSLPVYDSSGNPYYYWIEEIGANGFTPSYSFADGDGVAIEQDWCINAADPSQTPTATVKNTPNDTATTLPLTGSVGTQRYYVTGIAIMLMALAGIYGFKRRQGRQS